MNCRVEIEIVIASFLLISARKTVDAGLHQAVGGELSSSRSKPGRIGGSGSADFVLCAEAIQIEHHDCGALPMVNDENKVIGMITDRDIAIAAATKGRLASEIPVGEVISRKVFSATLDEDIYTALKTMRHEKIRRLPVVNRDGMLQGILTLNDITLRAEDDEGRRHPELTYDRAMGTFKAICEHRPARRAAAA